MNINRTKRQALSQELKFHHSDSDEYKQIAQQIAELARQSGVVGLVDDDLGARRHRQSQAQTDTDDHARQRARHGAPACAPSQRDTCLNVTARCRGSHIVHIVSSHHPIL